MQTKDYLLTAKENALLTLEGIEEALKSLESQPPIMEKPLQKIVIYLNAGHGGLDPITGEYKTFPTDGKFYHFLNPNEVFFSAYEGHTNRIFAEMVGKELEKLGAQIVKTYAPVEDRLNRDRLLIANSHWAKAKQEGKRGLWLSFHSNAIGMNHTGTSQEPRGLCIFTSPSATESDAFAKTWLGEILIASKGFGITNRGCLEANFEELVGTSMPAVLIENLFFTNIDDAKLLVNPVYQRAITQATKEAVLKHFAVA